MGKLILNGKEYLGDGVKDVKVNGTSVVTDRVAEVTAVQDNPTFTEASTRTNIASGESFATILGKIKKWFSDLASMFVSKSGDTMTGTLNVASSSEEVLWCYKNHSDTASKLSEITVGNTKADGTSGASHGGLILMGKSNRYALLQATNIASTNKTIELPNASGTLALTKDVIPYKTDGGLGGVEGNGTVGYALIAEIKPNDQYQNRPIYFEVSGRETIFVTLTLRFNNTTSTDPGLDIFTANTSDVSRFRIFKTATATWQLYYYLKTWDTITLHRISGQQSGICTPKMTWVSASNLPVTWEDGRVPTHGETFTDGLTIQNSDIVLKDVNGAIESGNILKPYEATSVFTTRINRMPNKDGTLALTSDITTHSINTDVAWGSSMSISRSDVNSMLITGGRQDYGFQVFIPKDTNEYVILSNVNGCLNSISVVGDTITLTVRSSGYGSKCKIFVLRN